ncbi:hypothetical protein [Nocardia sp. NPDC005745]|uniref:hypothetical protein n=1 Tax=Nocardia sp. NPDC005745 TaxID=3157061 RepID=UPI0033C5C53B
MTMTWQDVVRMATGLPEVEESTWWRSPALKAGGKGFARLCSDAVGGLVLAWWRTAPAKVRELRERESR